MGANLLFRSASLRASLGRKIALPGCASASHPFPPVCGGPRGGSNTAHGHLLPAPSMLYVRSMLWLARPPYLRWFAAGAIILAAASWDLSKRQTDPYPFASEAIARGERITVDSVEWRDVPSGLFTVPDLAGTSAMVDIVRGTPITESVVSRASPLPPGWWSIPIDLPVGTAPGLAVRVVTLDGRGITGVVVQPAVRDSFGSVEPGVVGFPPEFADVVARLSANGDLVVLVEG